ncbi:PIN domain-containing protein [Staphylothermus hellenicus]|uniref:PIN domain-containing protein n=1 Tax=Staphylothermus hellenicus TaxID=84599 RepID=UPI0001C44174|nr:PIN domain-containing protein [Staphylothermus hellenicus]
MIRSEEYAEVAQIKVRGDDILKKSRIPSLRNRRLSIVDSTLIVLAKRKNAPIITGDKDLRYVAEKENVNVIW